MPRGKRLTKDDRQKIIDLHNAGMKNSVIAYAMEISATSVRNTINKFGGNTDSLRWVEKFQSEWEYWTTLISDGRCG